MELTHESQSKVESVEPTSPPLSATSGSHFSNNDQEQRSSPSPPASPEIRVTDSPIKEEPGSPIASSLGSPMSSAAVTRAYSPIASPLLPPPPMLFQPFLPHNNHHNKIQVPSPTRPLAFSIDNILKPTFGQQLLLHNIAAAAAVAQHQRARQLEISSDLSSHLGIKKEPFPAVSPPAPQPKTSTTHHSSNNNNNHHSSQPHQPVDLSSTKLKDSNSPTQIPKNEDATSKDSDCPPGMVRGPNGQLWPAWVFCTRYSDRPSSGE